MSQTGSSTTGSYSVPASGAFGDITGAVIGSSLTFTLTQNNVACSGSFSGSATVTSSTMAFTFTGNDCLGAHSNGQGSATRQ